MAPVPAPAGATLTIDLGAIRRNYRRLRPLAGRAETAAVVKADAYGCGIGNVVPALAQDGARTFFVALIDEAIAARHALEGVPDARVFVLGGYTPGSAPLLAEHGALPVLGSLPEIEAWLADGGGPGAALHVDTGMSRLGLDPAECDAPLVAAFMDRAPPALLMTHMACADVTEHPLNRTQIERFADVRQRFPDIPASLANSAALMSGLAHDTALARPGIALFGGRALDGRDNPMEPVVRVDARIIQTRNVRAGESVGYGATWTAHRDRRIAVVSIGYADGYLRAATGGNGRPAGYAAIGGARVPLVGRVSMDLIALDVTELAPEQCTAGMTVEMLGPTVTVDDVADAAGTIGYEILTNLGSRYHRVIVDTEAER